MKKFLNEYHGEDNYTVLQELEDPWGDKYVFLLDEATQQISFARKGKNTVKTFTDYMKRHPFLTGIAVSAGLGMLDRYKTSKRTTTRLFAQTPLEKRMYADMARELQNTGKYTIIKNGKRIKGGWLWELKRKGAF